MNPASEDNTETVQLKTEIAALQTTLQETEEELANIQMSLEEAEKSPEKEIENSEATSAESASNSKTILRIERGMDSTAVANELAKSNIIENAAQFEVYLAKNNLSGKIQIGEYNLNSSMAHEEIGKLITSAN